MKVTISNNVHRTTFDTKYGYLNHSMETFSDSKDAFPPVPTTTPVQSHHYHHHRGDDHHHVRAGKPDACTEGEDLSVSKNCRCDPTTTSGLRNCTGTWL